MRVLSIRRTGPTRAATATSTRPFTTVIGSSGSGGPGGGGRGWGGSQHGERGGAYGVGVALAGRDRLLGGAQRLPERERAAAVLRTEADVAAREREAVGLADGGDDHDAGGEVEVTRHAAQD